MKQTTLEGVSLGRLKRGKESQRSKNIVNQERGETGEALITASLQLLELWNYKCINGGYGTPFDKIIIPPGGGYAIEVKVCKANTIGFSRIEHNQRKGLDRFMKQVGRDHAHILAIWDANGSKRAFLIPWCQVRDDVLSGCRGSINMLDFPELLKTSKGWDLSCLKGIGGENDTII
jgi:hypothetical protein